MDFIVQSHLTYTLKAPSVVDNLHFIDTLTGTILTVIMVMMYFDSEHPPQCISLTQTMDEISVLVAIAFNDINNYTIITQDATLVFYASFHELC